MRDYTEPDAEGVELLVCKCMVPRLTANSDFCGGCHGHIVAERADALRKAAAGIAEGREIESKRPHGMKRLVGSGSALSAAMTAGAMAAIANAARQPSPAAFLHDEGCTATHHEGDGKLTPGCKACEYIARERMRIVPAERAGNVSTPKRTDVRTIKTARELYEAADMAERGIPIPGTQAYEMIEQAERDGDFERSLAVRESIKQWAPKIREAAEQRERDDAATLETTVSGARNNLGALDRAKQKRERRSARNRAVDANMRRGSRDGAS